MVVWHSDGFNEPNERTYKGSSGEGRGGWGAGDLRTRVVFLVSCYGVRRGYGVVLMSRARGGGGGGRRRWGAGWGGEEGAGGG